MPGDGDAVRVAGFGRIVDGGPLSDRALFVDQLPLTPREAAKYQREVLEPRLNPEGRDGRLPPEKALDHQARLCTTIWEGDCSVCNGDSGGSVYQVVPPKKDTPPGTLTYVHVGITSNVEGCARPDTVVVNTRVSNVKKWVEWQMRASPGGTAGAKPAIPSPDRSVLV